MIEIEFKIIEEFKDNYPHPVPAKKLVPDWYKKMSTHIDDHKSNGRFTEDASGIESNLTMKSCIPMRDVITSGYIIPLHMDMLVGKSGDENESFGIGHYNDYYPFKHVGTHPIRQIKNSPLEKNAIDGVLYKITNPWRVKTKPGYSCYFYSPYFHENEFKIIPGIVDTDRYHEINFPMVINMKRELPAVVKKGTPYVQVLPFKREQYSMKVSTFTEKEAQMKTSKMLGTIGNYYKDFFHVKKSYN